MKDVKILINNLKANSGNSIRRKISVRRKFFWNDYCEYLSKSWMKNIIQYEVAFVGEPAADIGWPKRDFFSGKSMHLKLLPLLAKLSYKNENHYFST